MTWNGEVDTTPLSEDMAPADLNRVMIATRHIAWAKVRELRELADHRAQARKDAKLAFARAFLSTEGPIEVRRQHATIAAADAQFHADAADELISACKKALEACHDDFEALRSMNADNRAERQGRVPL